jgi:hypothetical protein
VCAVARHLGSAPVVSGRAFFCIVAGLATRYVAQKFLL